MSTSNVKVWINEIEFNNGTKYSFGDDDIVLFVGANNVGKSKTLKEIMKDMIRTNYSANNKETSIMIKKINFSNNITEENFYDYFSNNFEHDSNGQYILNISNKGNYSVGPLYYDGKNLEKYYAFFFDFLSTENRLQLTQPILYNMQHDYNATIISEKLKKSDDYIKKLNKFLEESFKKSIDVYGRSINGQYIQSYKMGEKKEIEKTISESSRTANKILDELEELHNQGDGIRSAVGILSSLIVNNLSLFLIDEPEAFLHPPQAKLLGKEIVELSSNKQCFISTHSIDLIRGLLETKSNRIKIIKINRDGNKNEFHLLDNESIRSISNDKNLKYSNILNGLFYNKVVLCEDESDCKLYSTVLESLDLDLYQNTLFCAVGGKDQFKVIIPLLKKMNISYSIIADIDLINDKDKLKQLLNCDCSNDYSTIKDSHQMFLELFKDKMYNSVQTQDEIKEKIDSYITTDKYMSEDTIKKIAKLLKDISKFKILKSGGEAILPSGDCTDKYNEIKNYLNEKNIFILPCGEIERFCTTIDAHGDSFVNELFNKYPNINDTVYDDIRKFLKSVFKIN